MKLNFDVTPKELIIIKEILESFLDRDCKVWIFGSRAKGASLVGSDLDLALECSKKVGRRELSKIKIAFEDSRLPYKVDVIDLNSTEQYFKDLIDKEKKLLPVNPKGRVPEVRFSEFSGEWEEKRLEKITSLMQSGLSRLLSDSDIGLPVIRSSNLIDGKLDITNLRYWYKKDNQGASTEIYYLKEGDLLVNFINSLAQIGKVAKYSNILNREVIFTTNLMRLKFRDSITIDFIFNFFQTSRYVKYIHSITKPAVNQASFTTKDFNKLIIFIPKIQEQEKIASFLTAVDTKIEQLTQKETLLNEYKKGSMQKIFNQEIRFPPKGTSSQTQGEDDNGNEFSEWKEKKFGEIFSRVTTKNSEDNKNVLTISAQYGLINQEEYFSKSVSAKNVTGYYLLENGDFAYNKSYSNGYPMGAIKRLNRYDKGVVSTLYICFKIKNQDNPNFYEKYFDSGFLNKEINKIAQEGARNHGLLNVSVIEFFNDIKVPIPSPDEQTKIANFLSSIDKKIEENKKILEQTKQFKKALLQQMFV